MTIKEGSQLKVKIENGCLVISIGLDLLAFATDAVLEEVFKADPGPNNDYKEFGKSIVQVLDSEEEDGTTLIHRMLDRAVEEAIEGGYEGFIDLSGEEY